MTDWASVFRQFALVGTFVHWNQDVRAWQFLTTAFMLGAEKMAILQLFQEIALSEISLFTPRAIKEEHFLGLIHGMGHVSFLARRDNLCIVMQGTVTSCKPTLSQVAHFVHNENCLMLIRSENQARVEVLSPLPERECLCGWACVGVVADEVVEE